MREAPGKRRRPARPAPGDAAGSPAAAEELRQRAAHAWREGVAMSSALATDPWEMFATFQRMAAQALSAPQAVLEAMLEFNREVARIAAGESAMAPPPGDARFDREAWQNDDAYRRLSQAYLAWSASLDAWLANSGLEGIEAERARFMLRIMKDVGAPQNTLAGNPEAMRKARETNGASLREGFRHFIDDLQHNHGYPAVANRHAFKVGVDVANTPGAVVYRSELLELVQYQPTTPQVHATPLLYVFSQVNRFYLADLLPDRSLFRALLDAGIPVFAVSWRNPAPEHRHWGLDTYVDGVIRALDAAKAITGAPKVNLIGVCAGGLTATAAAGVLRARGRDDVASLSLFINILDNRPEDSDFGLWVSEGSVAAQKRQTRARGYFTEKQVFEMFAWLRPEDNVMSFMRSNYLLGEEPPSHPLLFWSMDYTRMPARLHSDFLDLSLHNALAKGELRTLGMRIDLGSIDYPVYMMAGSTDHITPWHACYRSVRLFGGQPEFVLTNQNHTQTLCARSDNRHLKYWRHERPRDGAATAGRLPDEPTDWLANAREQPGHWRDHWIEWLQARSGALRMAPEGLGSARFPVLSPAPGEYVLGR